MLIEDGKIVQISEDELFKYWLECWSDIYPYDEYRRKLIEKGVKITNEEK